MDEDDNIFDDDDALDFVMYEEANKDKSGKSEKKGCFGLLILLIIPAAGYWILLKHFSI